MLLHYLLVFIVAFLLITQWGICHIKCVESDTDQQTPQTDVSFGDKRLLVKISCTSPWNDSKVQVTLAWELDDNMQVPSNGDIQEEGVQQKNSCNGLWKRFFWLLKIFLDFFLDLKFKTSYVEEWNALLTYYNDNVENKNKQSAVAGIFRKGEEPIFSEIFFPEFGKHPEHAEKKLIPTIDVLLDKSKNITQTEGCILIYTRKSPCFKRNEPGNDTPCFFIISVKSYEWQKKYNLSTEVGFSGYWGPISRTMCKNYKQDYMQANVMIASFVMEHPKLILGSNCRLKCFFINNEAKDQFVITN